MVKITDDEFDEMLAELVNESSASMLLDIPGVYELVAKYFNNEVLERFEMRNSEDDSSIHNEHVDYWGAK